MDEIRDVARLYDIYEILHLDHRKKVFLCPLPQHVHHENTPSFSVKFFRGHQRWRCFGNCGKGGDVIDLIGYLSIPNYDRLNREHLKMAVARLQHVTVSPPRIVERKTSIGQGAWKQYVDELSSRVILYAEQRGLSYETLRKFKIGEMSGAMAIPAFEDGTLKAIKFRSTARNPKMRYWAQEGSVVALFNHDAVAYTDKPVLVVKGEIPVMLLDQYGLLACATTAGEANANISQWAHLFVFSPKVVVVTDNDRDPEIKQRIAAWARERADILKAELVAPPEKYKDIDEAILAEPEVMLPMIRGWLDLSTSEDKENKR